MGKGKTPKPDAALINSLKAILEEVVAAPRNSLKRFLERKARRIRKLAKNDWLVALDRAIGASVRRKRAAANLLSELIDLPEVKDLFRAWLQDADLAWRAEMIQFIGGKPLREFAPFLNDALEGNADSHCQAYAITAAGDLKDESNIPAMLRLAGDPNTTLTNRLYWALKDFPHPLFRPVLEQIFRTATSKRDRVIVAWGLGKLGDATAIRYLATMLDDPDVTTATSFQPGESSRAAQALCDTHGWSFKWQSNSVGKTRKRWQQLHPE